MFGAAIVVRIVKCCLTLALCFTLLLNGCKDKQDHRVITDLVGLFPAAETNHEVSLIDLGTAAARLHLLGGWSYDETKGIDSYVWSAGEESSLRFWLSRKRNLKITLRCSPFTFPDSPVQTIEISANKQLIKTINLSAGFKDYEISIPSDHSREGFNTLRFSYGFSVPPATVLAGNTDKRSLGVFWDKIVFHDTGQSVKPSAAIGETQRILTIPANSTVSFSFETPEESILSIKQIQTAAKTELQPFLRVVHETADEKITTKDFPVSSKPQLAQWTLPSPNGNPVRLTLSALTKDYVPNQSFQIKLVAPTIRIDKKQESSASWKPPQQRPHVFIYLIDTLRPDHLGCYGYDRPTSPNIDAFAKDAVLFTDASAQSSWTRPAVTSTLTGLLPQAHGANRIKFGIPATAQYLPEILQKSGYRTAAFCGNGITGKKFGFGRGYQLFRESEMRDSPLIAGFQFNFSGLINEWIFDWLQQQGGSDRLFFFAHTADPHGPYTPAEPYLSRFKRTQLDPSLGASPKFYEITMGKAQSPPQIREHLIDLYDGEIATNDHSFGELIRNIKSKGLYDSSMIILLSDHGEEFLEHNGWEHGRTLYEELLRIPLIIKFPGQWRAGTKVSATVNQIDIMPTILEYAGIATPPMNGKSFLKKIISPGTLNHSENTAMSLLVRGKLKTDSIRIGKNKLIRIGNGKTFTSQIFFDLESDPGERGAREVLPPAWKSFLLATQTRNLLLLTPLPAHYAPINEEDLERLAALGYAQ